MILQHAPLRSVNAVEGIIVNAMLTLDCLSFSRARLQCAGIARHIASKAAERRWRRCPFISVLQIKFWTSWRFRPIMTPVSPAGSEHANVSSAVARRRQVATRGLGGVADKSDDLKNAVFQIFRSQIIENTRNRQEKICKNLASQKKSS